MCLLLSENRCKILCKRLQKKVEKFSQIRHNEIAYFSKAKEQRKLWNIGKQ